MGPDSTHRSPSSAGSDGGWSMIMGGALAAFALVLAAAAASISPPAQSPAVVASPETVADTQGAPPL